MKKIFVVFAVLAVLTPCFIASAEDGEWKFNLSTGVTSQYLAKPGMVLYNRPIWENIFVFSLNQYYGGFWTSAGLNDRGIHHKFDFGDEIDLFGGFRYEFKILKIDLRASYFALNNFRNSHDDLWVIDSWLDLKTPLLTPYLYIRYFGEVGSESPERGWFYWVGVKKNLPLSDKISFNLNSSLAFSDGALRRDPGFIYGRIFTVANIKINDKVSLSPFLVIQIPAGGQHGKPTDYTDKREKFMFGVSLNINF